MICCLAASCCRAVQNEKINPRKSGTAEEVTNLPTRTFPKVEEKRVNDNKLGMEVDPRCISYPNASVASRPTKGCYS